MRTLKMLFAALALLVIPPVLGAAMAADLGGKAQAGGEPGGEDKPFSWTGFSVGGWAGHTIGSLDFGSPIQLSATGMEAGGAANYNVQVGQHLAGGCFAAASAFFGDLSDIGVKRSYEAGCRAGIVNGKVWAYGHVEWVRLDTSGLGTSNFTGIGYGPGVEFALSPKVTIDTRYVIRDIDTKIPGLDAESRTFRAGVNYKLN